jgi:hypothetical protein
VTILPSEEPSDLGRCNCDTLSPKRSSNASVMNRGFSDEAIVIVKFGADDGHGDMEEGKTSNQQQDVGGEGRNM